MKTFLKFIQIRNMSHTSLDMFIIGITLILDGIVHFKQTIEYLLNLMST